VAEKVPQEAISPQPQESPPLPGDEEERTADYFIDKMIGSPSATIEIKEKLTEIKEMCLSFEKGQELIPIFKKAVDTKDLTGFDDFVMAHYS